MVRACLHACCYSENALQRHNLCTRADVDATEISVQDRRIGFVFQSYALFKHMTCADNISFGPRMKQLDINVEERWVAFT